MLSEIQLEKINEPLLSWFETHKRVLPWRENPTPYRVWVSEIMLQQTRVEAVKPYFERFTKELPNVRHLAECDEERLFKAVGRAGVLQPRAEYADRSKNSDGRVSGKTSGRL